jgi:hypothetical protein
VFLKQTQNRITRQLRRLASGELEEKDVEAHEA